MARKGKSGVKTGIIDVGGGTRGIYGTGVMDYLMDNGIEFDCHIGVSAGAANLSSYIAGQRGRNYVFYTDYAFRPEYMGFKNYIQKGTYINLDYIYGELSNEGKEYPLDYPALKKAFDKGKEFLIVAMDVETGLPVYFSKDNIEQDDYGAIMASCCVPLFNKPHEFRGRKYFDGGLVDPVPIEKAMEMGCDKVVIILTKPRDLYRETDTDAKWSLLIEPSYPNAAKALARRGDVYNFYLDKAKEYEKEGKVLIVAPDDIGHMKTLTRSKEDIVTLYKKGYSDAAAIKDFLGP